MVGIVIVSHSRKVAEGIYDLVMQMASENEHIIPAGGLEDGSIGTDAFKIQAAIEAADVVIMDDDIARIPSVMGIARKTLSISKQNIAFALFVKFACLVLGALGIANMWIAVFADVGVTVLAVLNAMRALR